MKTAIDHTAFRPFTKTDWYGFAGAEDLPNGTPPHIASFDLTETDSAGVPIDSEGAVAILDGNGLNVVRGGSDGYFLWTHPEAMMAATRLRSGMSLDDLRALPGVSEF